MDYALLLEWIVKGVLLTFILLTAFAYTTLYERKFLARIQVRTGPHPPPPSPLSRPGADAIKLVLKEEFAPAEAYKIIYFLAPVLTMVPAVVIMAVIPWGETISLFGRVISLGVADVNVGVLYILSV